MPVARGRVVAHGADVGAQHAPARGRLGDRRRSVAGEAADAAQPAQRARQLVPRPARDRRPRPARPRRGVKPPSVTPGSPVAWQAMRARGVTRAERAAAIGRCGEPARHHGGHRAARRGRRDVRVAAGAAAVERRLVVARGAQRQRSPVAVREPPVAGHVGQQAGGAGRGGQRRRAAGGARGDMPAIAAEVDARAHGRVGQTARAAAPPRRAPRRAGAGRRRPSTSPRSTTSPRVAATAARCPTAAVRPVASASDGMRAVKVSPSVCAAAPRSGGPRDLAPVDAAAGGATRERGAHGKTARRNPPGRRALPAASSRAAAWRARAIGGNRSTSRAAGSRRRRPGAGPRARVHHAPPPGSCRTGSGRSRSRCRSHARRRRSLGDAAAGDTAAAVDAGRARVARGGQRPSRGIAIADAPRGTVVQRPAAPAVHVAVGKIGREVDADPLGRRRAACAGRRTISRRAAPGRRRPPALRPRRRSPRRCPCSAIRRRRACAGEVARSSLPCRRTAASFRCTARRPWPRSASPRWRRRAVQHDAASAATSVRTCRARSPARRHGRRRSPAPSRQRQRLRRALASEFHEHVSGFPAAARAAASRATTLSAPASRDAGSPTLQPRKKGGATVSTQASAAPLSETRFGGVAHQRREADVAHRIARRQLDLRGRARGRDRARRHRHASSPSTPSRTSGTAAASARRGRRRRWRRPARCRRRSAPRARPCSRSARARGPSAVR